MTFEMQSWSSSEATWKSMDKYNIAKWKPKKNAPEAARHCLEWTGLISIPAMQVVDQETGNVVWRDSERYPEAGESIVPEWDAMVRRSVQAAFKAEHQEETSEAIAKPPAAPSLFDFVGGEIA